MVLNVFYLKATYPRDAFEILFERKRRHGGNVGPDRAKIERGVAAN